MLEAQDTIRPPSADTVYIIDVNLTALEEQMRQMDTQLKNRIDAGEITLSVRDPTQSLLGALVIHADAYDERLDRALVSVKRLAQGLGLNTQAIALDLGNGEIGFNIEMYQNSISHAQRSFTVSDLPA